MRAGRIVGGRFEIEREAGAGGMATVHRARDLETGAPVAVKVLRAAEDADRFEREARILAGLAHEGIVRYVAHGTASDGTHWLAMEWIEGESLEHFLDRHRLSVRESVDLARRVAAALGAAHAKGFVHRDLKPTNLVLERGELERVRIIDFGIALASGARRRTTTGFIIGTAEYMAPEQARCERLIDARADVYALGCVLFDCLAGQPPFIGEQVAAVLAKVLFVEAPSVGERVPEVPDVLDDLVSRMLAKDPSARPPDGDAVRMELESILASRPGAARATPCPPAALGGGEQRHVSLVMLGGSVPPGGAGHEPGRRLEALDPIAIVVRSFDARAERLADGSAVILLPAVGTATDQAARAAACALDLRSSLPNAPVAIATGRAELGRGLPVGDAIDRAAGLLRRPFAQAGGPIWIDDVTSGLLDERFVQGEESGGTTLSGRRDVDTVRTLCGIPTPFVGRDAQLAVLEGAFDECVRESVPRVFLVTAPPGAGKSRLRHELLARLRARGERLAIWVARGEPVGAGSAFGLAAQIVRRTAGVLDGEPLVDRHGKLRARIGEHVGSADQERVARFLGEMIGAPFPQDADRALEAARRDPVLMGDQIRRAWEDLVDAECAAHPLLVVLDDLQWGDRPSVMLADSVLRLFPERPLTILGFGRPEVDDLFSGLWRERDVQRIRLGGLPRRAATQLARSVLGETAADEIVERIIETAAGNAFYLEELIRAQKDGRGHAAVPTTVVAMVQSRLDALPPQSRRILRAASVFGQAFWMAGLEELLGPDSSTADARRCIEELIANEVLVRRPVSRFAGQTELSFRHALVREGAYAMLTEADRKLGHALAARWLERAGETEAIVIAEHLERGGEPVRAAAAYRRAAEQALEGNDLDAAIARARRGVGLGAEGEARGRLMLVQAEAHRWRGQYAEAERCALASMPLFSSGSDPWSDAARVAAQSSVSLGHAERLVALGEELARHLVTLQEGTGPPPGCLRAGAIVASCLMGLGRYEEGYALLATVEAAVKGRELGPTVRARILVALATRALHEGRSAEPAELVMQAAAAYDEAHDARNACSARVNAGVALGELGAYVEARESLERSLEIARRLGLENLVALAQQNLGRVLGRLGRHDEARAHLLSCVEAFKSHGDRRTEGCGRAYLAATHADTGRAADAERELESAVELLRAAPPVRAQALALLARLRLRAGRADEALALAREAMEPLTSLGRLEEGESLVRLVLVEALEATGASEEAARVLQAARERLLARAATIGDPRWRECFLEDVPEHSRTLALAAERLGPAGA